MVTPQEIKNSIQKGLVWLSTHQNEDGSWGSSTYYPIGTTGLALLKLEGYAVENGISPFSNAYPYHQNVLKGLNYLFSVAKENVHGIYFEESGRINYEQGIVLAALTVGSDPNLIVNVPGSVADSKTYKQVADLMVQYLVYSQDPNGGWAYELGDIPDNSVSGYVILGLEIAENPEYNFNCIIPATLKSKLNNWIDFIQNDVNGGSGYQESTTWVNMLKTGSLIQQMRLMGDTLSSSRLSKAIAYIADNWNNPINQYADNAGWKGTPVDYQTTFTVMKGFSGYGIEFIQPTSGAPINWYQDVADAIVGQQKTDGSWPLTFWDPGDRILSTVWALLTLEKEIIKQVPEIPYVDNIIIKPHEIQCPWNLEETIEIQGEIKVFAYKYSHSEAACIPGLMATKGDDIGFTLVYGNYGEFNYIAPMGKPTVEDKFTVQRPIILKLMSLCVCDGYKLFYGNSDKEVKVCDKFYGQIGIYTFQLRKLVNGSYISDFNLPCHHIRCLSMLLQIEFPSCPDCPDDCPNGNCFG